MPRKFESKPAKRESTPLLLGLIGASTSGKTFSALRLATGIQRVSPGKIFFVDTEARRALHYADKFDFEHVPFAPPFSPGDYIEAIKHCVDKGAATIIIDSCTHEHSGQGGVLEMHEAEAQRLAREWRTTLDKVKITAWNKPKTERRKLVNTILQTSCNFILCFRAKEKLKIETGKDPLALGFMPEAGEEYVYEMVAKFLLYPGSRGIPTLDPQYPGEKLMTKLPEQFVHIFRRQGKPPPQLSEDIGEELARWAAGTAATPTVPAAELVKSYEACGDDTAWQTLEVHRRSSWRGYSKTDKERVKAASDAAADRLTKQLGHDPGTGEVRDMKPEDAATPAVPPAEDPPEPGSNG
jgi:hypothetical protein